MYTLPIWWGNIFYIQYFYKNLAFVEAMKRTKPEVTVIAPDQIIADPVQVLDLNLKYTDQEELAMVHAKNFVSVQKSDKFQGLALWFKTDFFNYTNMVAKWRP